MENNRFCLTFLSLKEKTVTMAKLKPASFKKKKINNEKNEKVVPLLYSNSPPLRQGGLRKSAFETNARWPHEIRLTGAAVTHKMSRRNFSLEKKKRSNFHWTCTENLE